MLVKISAGIALLILAAGAVVYYAFKKAYQLPVNHTAEVLKKGVPAGKETVVFMGDSLTHGRVSHDYVSALAEDEALSSYFLVNEGINSRLVYNLLTAVEDVARLKPRFIFILIGSNDVKASLSQAEYEGYQATWNLPQRPDQTWFVENYEKLLSSLQKKTGARVILITLPPLGEQPGSEPYERSRRYAAETLALAQKHQLRSIDYFGYLDQVLKSKSHGEKHAYKSDTVFMYRAVAEHLLLGRTWNAISKSRDLVFLTDRLHLNQRAGEVLVREIKKVLATRP